MFVPSRTERETEREGERETRRERERSSRDPNKPFCKPLWAPYVLSFPFSPCGTTFKTPNMVVCLPPRSMTNEELGSASSAVDGTMGHKIGLSYIDLMILGSKPVDGTISCLRSCVFVLFRHITNRIICVRLLMILL